MIHYQLWDVFTDTPLAGNPLAVVSGAQGLADVQMQRIAQDFLVLQLSGGSGMALGLTTALQFLPLLLFGLWGGALVDRMNKRRLLITTQATMGVLALGLVFRNNARIGDVLASATGRVYRRAWRHALHGGLVTGGALLLRDDGVVGVAIGVLVALCALGIQTLAQQYPPGFVDPAPILAAASKAISEENLRCVTFSGTGYSGPVGQTFENAQNIDWPRSEMANYTRTINWETGTSKETFDRKPGESPAAWRISSE